MNEIICPMLATNTVIDENSSMKIDTQPVFRIKEQCAWWVEDKQKCAITAMGGEKRGK